MHNLCRGCGAQVIWIKTLAGANMICEPEPLSWDDVEEGEIVISEDGETRKSKGELIDDERIWYRPHWPTCPARDKFRRKK